MGQYTYCHKYELVQQSLLTNMIMIIVMVLMMLIMSMLIVVQSYYNTIVLYLHALTVRPSTGSVRPV